MDEQPTRRTFLRAAGIAGIATLVGAPLVATRYRQDILDWWNGEDAAPKSPAQESESQPESEPTNTLDTLLTGNPSLETIHITNPDGSPLIISFDGRNPNYDGVEEGWKPLWVGVDGERNFFYIEGKQDAVNGLNTKDKWFDLSLEQPDIRIYHGTADHMQLKQNASGETYWLTVDRSRSTENSDVEITTRLLGLLNGNVPGRTYLEENGRNTRWGGFDGTVLRHSIVTLLDYPFTGDEELKTVPDLNVPAQNPVVLTQTGPEQYALAGLPEGVMPFDFYGDADGFFYLATTMTERQLSKPGDAFYFGKLGESLVEGIVTDSTQYRGSGRDLFFALPDGKGNMHHGQMIFKRGDHHKYRIRIYTHLDDPRDVKPLNLPTLSK